MFVVLRKPTVSLLKNWKKGFRPKFSSASYHAIPASVWFFFFYVKLNIFLQQAIGHQHGDAGLSTEESHDTAQTEQLGIPIQEQHSHFLPGFCVGASGISNHVEESAARSRYLCGYQQLPYQSEDDNQASGRSPRLARIRQGGSQTIRPQGRLNAPVQEEGPSHGYDYGNGLQNRVTSTQLKEQITENCCSTHELQQLWNQTESLRRRVV